MSSDQYGWPQLDPNEIKAPNNSGQIKWNTKSGSTVRVGQLLATVMMVAPSSDASNSTVQSGANIEAAKLIDSSASAEKPKIIRARRIKRKVKPVSSAGASSSTVSNGNGTAQKKEDEIKRPESSFLGQYLKSTMNTNNKAAESRQQPPKKDGKSDIQEVKAGVDVASPTPTPTPVPTSTLSSKKTDGSQEIRAHIDGFLHTYVTIQCRRDSNNKNQLTYVLGKIEPCTHPAVIDGLCAVCGQAQRTPTNGHGNSHENSNGGSVATTNGNGGRKEASTQALTLSGGVTVSISTEYAQTFSTHTSQSLRSAKKLNLVLDLDHTLLHATADQRAASLLEKCSDLHTLLLPFMEGHPFYQGGAVNLAHPHYVKLRPHLAEFLCGIMDQYEVTIYTAGTRGYAEKICEVIARHVADHLRGQKKVDGVHNGEKAQAQGGEGEIESEGCMDERDIIFLKYRIFHLTKERDEFLLHKKEETIQTEKKEGEDQQSTTNTNKEGEAEESADDNGGTHMMASEEDDGDENLRDEPMIESNGKKRKRVTFALPEDNSSTISAAAEKKVTSGGVLDRKDPREELEKLQRKLKLEEKYETEAQNLRMKIFGSRIISRTDVTDLGRDVKSLKRVFPCGGMMAAIVDDREDVWANADNNSSGRKGEPPDNLLLCKPYHWNPFQKYADVNNSAGEDLTESVEHDEHTSMDESGEHQLIWTGGILRRIHERYYSSSLNEEQRNKLSVPAILKDMRNEVFGKTKPSNTILLSGLVPLHKQNQSFGYQSSPRPPVIRYAEELGSTLVRDVSGDLTHVVAARDGTDKILRARNIPGCAIVTISWLMECYWSITLVDIKKHILGRMPLPRQQIDARPKNILLSDGSDSEEEDDDFFNDFEKEMKS